MCLGIPARIVTCDENEGIRMGSVDFGGTSRRVCLAYVPEAVAGDYVVVHAGFAISVVDEAEAERTLALLRSIGEGEEHG